MANIVGKLDAEKSARNEQMEQVTRFLKDVDLPKPLSRKIIDFFSASVKDVKPYDRDAVITQLPFELRSKIMQHVYLPTIKAVPVLKRFAEDELFLTDLCTRLHPYRCSAETFVYQKGEDHCDMYILLRGEMHVLDSDRRSYLFKIPEGTVFGESGPLRKIEGYGRARRQENVFCQTECDMLRITSEDVTVMCEHYPQLYKDLHKLDKSRQNRYKIVYGADSSLSQSPFNQPVGPSQPSSTSDNSAASHGGFFHTQQQAGGLTSLPASGLSQTHPRMPTLVDRNPLAGGGEMSIAPTMESYPGDLEDNNLKDVLLGAEMAALKQQVDSRQAEVMQQLEEQKKMLMLLVAKLSTFSSLGMTSSSNNGNGGIMIDFASMPSSEPTMDSWLKRCQVVMHAAL
ncbi:hypothetical protein CEUSTIGMA_g13754.t1 [Chlamydomonas eustigma]|uniref:Cyclic nucleotide-binding domain-containing protein n=1 Tax=Chlamydomonas eustigma TaxID=1157962 RepID=A0A250XTT7_9CHLO|nr:hypothetical protein CEUSTIGMA_g13754.t1 [Chlamydomonas eustigma]|eukprot:GAX86342.1 hypothetical protein CEUSTIGMA_g13754.t1 [Chlamydomonas eustigma]